MVSYNYIIVKKYVYIIIFALLVLIKPAYSVADSYYSTGDNFNSSTAGGNLFPSFYLWQSGDVQPPLGSVVYGIQINIKQNTHAGDTHSYRLEYADGSFSACNTFSVPAGTGLITISLPIPITIATTSINAILAMGYTDSNCTTTTNDPYIYQAYTGTEPPNGYHVVYYNSDLVLDSGTRILTTTPQNGSVVATTTSLAIGYTGNLNSSNLGTNTKVDFHIQNGAQTFSQCADVQCVDFATGSFSYNHTQSLSSAGAFVFSDTLSNPPIGKYYMTIKVTTGANCLFGYCLSNNSVISTSTSFTVATSTVADNILDALRAEQARLAGSGTANFDACKISSFDLFSCGQDLLIYSFVPPPDSLAVVTDEAKNGFLSHAPFGYATRLVDILSTTTATALPSFSAPVRIGPSTTTDTILMTFDINDIVSGAGTQLNNVRDPYYGKNIRDIAEPIVQLIVGIAVLLVIIKDTLGSHQHGDLPQGRNV